MKKITTKKLTTLALLCAMALILSFFVRIPLVPAVSFLKFDPKDVVIAIGGFIYGPAAALAVTMVTALLELLFTGATWIDWVMNVISTASFVCTAAIIYKKIHTKNGALIGLCVGMVLNVISMVLWNYIMDPLYFGMPREAVVSMLPAIALFNLVKCSLNACITLFIYKPVVQALRHAGLVEQSISVSGKKSALAISAFVGFTLMILVLTFSGIL